MRFGPIHTARPNRGSHLLFLALVMCYPGGFALSFCWGLIFAIHFSLAELLFLLAIFKFWSAI